MTIYQFFLILRARYRVVILVLFLALAAALAASLLMPSKYTAQTSLLVDVRTPDPVAGAGMSGVIAPSYMATQVDIIGGDLVAQRVVKMLKLDEDEETKKDWQKATEGRGSLDSWIAKNLQSALSVQPARESNVINITYKGGNAENVALVANAFAQAYLDTNLSLKTEPARLYAKWFDEQTKVSRAKLEDAQARLSDYQQKAGIVSSDERVDYETAKLAQISTQLTAVQGETTDSQSKRNARGDTVAEVMQSTLINGLKADIARLEAKVNENNVNLGVNHPLRQRAEAELASLRNRLAAESNRISASIETAYRVGKDRERELQAAVNAQRTRVLGLNKQRDELNVYRRDVEAAQRAYETVSQSASQSRLQSLTNQTNVVRLNTALAPIDPSSPKLPLNLLIAAFVGTLLGVGFALVCELMNRRVRSSEDLMQMLDLPVLANISSNGTKRRMMGGAGHLALPNGSPA
ncbi:chain length determinant protein EpsF [Polaromonas sp. CG_9.11]|uniref:chain length determinant protein EpsF n=1 Tax=Polaromonas sp. CG_9.11 TaxID=2787730 RepID=UPI0018CA287F|nr:chain length determinant protein EpsF [Polaromonas sp. CG_9.11]MBG6076053.1 chain length determinant protein EpsF [Polaromonas sp. CG_9.11]